MSNTCIDVTIDGSMATLTLSTESGINVLSSAVLEKLKEALAKVRDASVVRSLFIRAEGKVFVAGADIKEMNNFSPEQARAYGENGQAIFNELEQMPCFTVAGINGAAMGGGLELALACDFRIAVKTAKLGLPETSLGLTPGWGGIGRLTRLIGPSRAKKMFFSAMPVSAEDGLAFGLVDEIVNSAEDVIARVPAFCKSFRRGGPKALALAKRAFTDGDEIGAFVECFGGDESREGLAAFVEKRPASWME